MQPQAEQVVGLLRPLDEFLQLVEDVTVKEPEQGPVDLQGVGRREATFASEALKAKDRGMQR